MAVLAKSAGEEEKKVCLGTAGKGTVKTPPASNERQLPEEGKNIVPSEDFTLC